MFILKQNSSVRHYVNFSITLLNAYLPLISPRQILGPPLILKTCFFFYKLIHFLLDYRIEIVLNSKRCQWRVHFGPQLSSATRSDQQAGSHEPRYRLSEEVAMRVQWVFTGSKYICIITNLFIVSWIRVIVLD